MTNAQSSSACSQGSTARSPTGISGLDEIANGGVPTRRTTLVLGGPGCGKTLLGTQFIQHGCSIGEPGIIVTVEQDREHLVEDARSIGIEIETLEAQDRLRVLAINLHQQEFAEAGRFTLDGLLMNIETAVGTVGAKRLLIDQLDGFFTCFEDARTLRSEFLRLARRFSKRGITVLILGSPAGGSHRMEEYLSDCVVHLDHRITKQMCTRRLRIAKYRGTAHGTDEYPFAITSRGLRVYPITSSKLDYDVSQEMLSTGIPGLDDMLGGGCYRGGAMMICGQAGTGKTTLACQIAAHASSVGLRCLYFSFEESPQQLFRNAKSVAVDLSGPVAEGSLLISAARPTVQGLEQHLGALEDRAISQGAQVVILDPITNLIAVGSNFQVKAMLTRLVDALRRRQVTLVFTSLVGSAHLAPEADIAISSLMDVLVDLENRLEGETRRRRLSVVKARGMPSSPNVGELRLSGMGIDVRSSLS